MKTVGLVLIGLGLALVVVGGLAYLGALSWFGRLPGDLRWQGERVRVYVPFVSMLLVSLVLSALAWLVRRWL